MLNITRGVGSKEGSPLLEALPAITVSQSWEPLRKPVLLSSTSSKLIASPMWGMKKHMRTADGTDP